MANDPPFPENEKIDVVYESRVHGYDSSNSAQAQLQTDADGHLLVEDASSTNASGEQEVDIESVSVTSVPIQENNPLDVSGATVPVQEATPLDVSGAPVPVEDSTGTQVDPAKNVDGSSTTASASGTGSSNAATISVPDGRSTVTLAFDTSGAANVYLEVSPDGGTTWYPLDSHAPASAAKDAISYDVGFDDVRAYIDSNLNTLHIGAKGT